MKNRLVTSLLLFLLTWVFASPAFGSVPLWELSAGDRPYLDTTSTQRSVAYNPFTGNIYVPSEVGGADRIFILDAVTGADGGELSTAGIEVGLHWINQVAVAADGTIYATNITLDPVGNPFRVYRWENESAQPETIYSGDPSAGATGAFNLRWGKNMTLRGTKDSIEILVISAGTVGALFTGSDSLTTTTFTDLPRNRFERGLAWGEGDTFYANHSQFETGLHHFALDRAAGTTEVLEVFDATVLPHRIGPIMVDLQRRVLGGIEAGAAGVRQYAVFYDLDSLSSTFPNTAFLSVPFTNRGNNATGYGGMAYGDGLAFAMNTRSGLLAVEVPGPVPAMKIEDLTRVAGDDLEFSIRSRLPVEGVTHELEGTLSLTEGSWNPVSAEWIQPLLGGQALLRVPMPAEDRFFYRLRANRIVADGFFEDFETGGPGWTSGGDNNSWEIGVPTSGPGTAVSGQNVAATNLSGNYPANSNAWLRSPVIDLRGATEAALSFSEYVDVDDYETFHGTVVSILDATTLEELEELSRVNLRDTGWRTRNLPLSAASLDREVVAQFRLFSDDINMQTGWYIDDVSLGAPTLLLIAEHTTSLASVTVNGTVLPAGTGGTYVVDLGGAPAAEIAALASDPGALVFINGVLLAPGETFTYHATSGLPAFLTVEVFARDGENMESYTIEIRDADSAGLWELTVNAGRDYITTGNRQRSIAYNKFTGNVYVASRDATADANGDFHATVAILNGETGAHVGELSMNGISGGVFLLSEIDVAEDGTIYGSNLTLEPGPQPFRIYRWLNESAHPELIYSGDPSNGNTDALNKRWGKNMAVRGTKDAVEILVLSAGTYAALFTGSDSLTALTFTDLEGTRPERGVAFGEGDTFFRKHARSGDRELREFSFDRVAGTTQLLRAFPVSVFSNMIGPIFVDLERGILGAMRVGDVGVTQYAEFYELDTLSTTSVNVPFLSVPFSLTNNSRDGYGDIVYGDGRAWALNTNNGLLAVEVPDPDHTDDSWALFPGDRPYITTGNLQRSIAYNPVTGNVYVASRDATADANGDFHATVAIMNGATGEHVGEISMQGISGGVFLLSEIDVAGDGTIYGSNLTLEPGPQPFRIYRWLNESAHPELIYSGDPSNGNTETFNKRWGKNMAVRGTKDAVEILVLSAGTYAALFTGSDSLTAQTFTDLVGTRPERGVAFGQGDTFFRKHARSGDQELREFSFDRAAGTTELLRAFPTTVFPATVGPIYVDLDRRILGAIQVGTDGTQQFAQFYNLDTLSTTEANTPFLSVPFSLMNNSRDGYGDIVYGDGWAWALNTNNGLLAVEVPNPE